MQFKIKNEHTFLEFCNLFNFSGPSRSEIFLEVIRALRASVNAPIIEIKFIASKDLNVDGRDDYIAERLNQTLEKNINEIIN